MRLYDLLDKDELEADIARRMVGVQSHPTLPLRIYNYTQSAQFSSDPWTTPMLHCRGLIVDADDNIAARPFSKFWNMGDIRYPETMPENLPPSPPILSEKLDGSLGILYPTPDGPAVATRGSFKSEQAVWATAFLRGQHPDLVLPDNETILVEVIYPANRIVCNYGGAERLALLAIVDNETGQERDIDSFPWLDKAHRYSMGLYEAVSLTWDNFEGFVAAWPRSGQAPLRVKIKLEEYKRLHRLYTHTSPRIIWECLRDNTVFDLSNVPPDFGRWTTGVIASLRAEYDNVLAQAQHLFANRPVNGTRKDAALYFTRPEWGGLASVAFAMLDGKPVEPIIWKMVRPEGGRAFRCDEE